MKILVQIYNGFQSLTIFGKSSICWVLNAPLILVPGNASDHRNVQNPKPFQHFLKTDSFYSFDYFSWLWSKCTKSDIVYLMPFGIIPYIAMVTANM